ncbi:MAG: rhodanese-like domain-containing protein [Cyanobacteria bacterium QS_8_64_29]|nr:MAG: rhodanese-like domain-containing protein [Cyanobacteria bacterium QS_8_64_29]
MAGLADLKRALSRLVPIPSGIERSRSRAYDLKMRLDWGQPALTIVDVRDRRAYNISHIQGAVSMPRNELLERALATLEPQRDIYIYGDTDEDTAAAAQTLRTAGFQRVTELRGGVAGWKAFGYPVESMFAYSL